MSNFQVPYVYVLTPLTRISAKRRTVMLGFDMERRTLLLGTLGTVISLPFMLLTWWLLSYFAALFLPASIGAVFYAFSRSGGGLKQTQLQTRVDRMTSKSGQFVLCGRTIKPRTAIRTTLLIATVATRQPTATPTADYFDRAIPQAQVRTRQTRR